MHVQTYCHRLHHTFPDCTILGNAAYDDETQVQSRFTALAVLELVFFIRLPELESNGSAVRGEAELNAVGGPTPARL